MLRTLIRKKGAVRREADCANAKCILAKELTDYFKSANTYLGDKSAPRAIRIEIGISNCDPISWLASQSNAITRIYWSDRDNTFEMAGIGEASVIKGRVPTNYLTLFDSLTKRFSLESGDIRYFGGIRFPTYMDGDECWADFGQYRFVIPRFEICKRGGRLYFACNFVSDPCGDPEETLERLLNECASVRTVASDRPSYRSVVNKAFPTVLRRADIPDQTGWNRNLDIVLQRFDSKFVQKVVLARKAIFEFSNALDPLDVLKSQKAANPAAYHFCFQFGSGIAFVGASPERLYKRVDKTIQTEAIAGTRARGATEREDRRLESDLMESEKDMLEHKLVLDFIAQTLRPLCKNVEATPTQILKRSRVQHLYTGLRAELRAGIGDRQLMEALHPTPAVGGLPREKAIAAISVLEAFDRGWYASPVGWVGKGEADFSVAIRSGLVAGNRLELFSGAGIVRGSNPDDEWNEVEQKIKDSVEIFAR